MQLTTTSAGHLAPISNSNYSQSVHRFNGDGRLLVCTCTIGGVGTGCGGGSRILLCFGFEPKIARKSEWTGSAIDR